MSSEPTMTASESEFEYGDIRLALWAQALYLINLLVLPGIAWLILLVLYRKTQQRNNRPLATTHLREAFNASNWAGGLIFTTILILWIGGAASSTTWVVAILYFTLVHSSFVLLGVLGLSRAFAGERYHYPLIGKRTDV